MVAIHGGGGGDDDDDDNDDHDIQWKQKDSHKERKKGRQKGSMQVFACLLVFRYMFYFESIDSTCK